MKKILFQKRLFLNDSNLENSDSITAVIERHELPETVPLTVLRMFISTCYAVNLEDHAAKEEAMKYLNNLQNAVNEVKAALLGIEVKENDEKS